MTPTSIKYPYTVTQIIDHLSDPKQAIQFFRKTNIAEINQIKNFHPYARTDGRRGLVLIATEKGFS
jgi:hypothetical protein